MKLTVSTYSFSQALRDGRFKSLLELPAKAAEMGFEGVEIVSTPEEMFDQAKALRKAAGDAGVAISSACVGADFLSTGVAAQVDQLRKAVDACAIMGAPVLRHDATRGVPPEFPAPRSFASVLPRLAEGYRAVTEYAAGLGVHTSVENHGYFCQDSDRVEALINAVGHPNFGALIDIGNFLCVDEDPVHAVSRLAGLAVHAHAKDFLVKKGGRRPGEGWFSTRGGNWLRGTIIGHGQAPVQQCLFALKRAGYDGWLSLEFEGIEDCMLGIRDGKQNLDAMLAELA